MQVSLAHVAKKLVLQTLKCRQERPVDGQIELVAFFFQLSNSGMLFGHRIVYIRHLMLHVELERSVRNQEIVVAIYFLFFSR